MANSTLAKVCASLELIAQYWTNQHAECSSVLLKCALFLTAVLVTPFSFARGETPDAMLNAVTMEVMSILKQDSETAAGMRTNVADLVETKIQPLFDFPRMTQIALARNWRLASAEQQVMRSSPRSIAGFFLAAFLLSDYWSWLEVR